MDRDDTLNGLRIGHPNQETDDQFKERVKGYIFDFLCSRLRDKKATTTYEEMMERINGADPSISLGELAEINFNDELINSNDDLPVHYI